MQISFVEKCGQLADFAIQIVLTDKKNTETIIEQGKKSLHVGVGEKNKITRKKWILLLRKLIRTAKAHQFQHIALSLEDLTFPQVGITPQEMGELLGVQITLANYEFTIYKSKKEEKELQEVTIVGTVSDDFKKAVAKGMLIGEGINTCRDLANTPAMDMTPSILVQRALKLMVNEPVKIDILEKEKMQELGMGGVLGVAQGSLESPKFLIMEYKNSETKPIVFVGKGVTFDTGGVNIKPENSMLGMHMDMTGGASIIATIATAAKLRLPVHVIGLVPAVENMPSGSSYRPNDILRMMSGKTVEVLNTDAEGRLILADALTYAKRYNPQLVIDVATLTGASLVALGQVASAVFTKDEELQNKLIKLGQQTANYVWPLPLWEEFTEDIRSNFADLSNLARNLTRFGGASHGAAFLAEFAEGYPWAHLDIAPRMTTIKSDYLSEGCAGEPVYLLVKLLEQGGF